MSRQKVRNMPRRQQKAVFARMGKDDTVFLQSLQGAEAYQRRRNYLIKKKDLEETTEDKLFNVWDSGKLTHRQKMARAAEIRKQAAKKLGSLQKEEKQSLTAEFRQERGRRFEKQVKLEEEGKENYKVVAKLPAVGDEPASTQESEPMGKEAAEKKAKDMKRLGWYAGVVKASAKLKDSDKDGVIDSQDCEPMNPKKQDAIDIIGKVGFKAVKFGYKKLKGKSSKQRIQEAQYKIRKIKEKQDVEKFEAEAKTKEAEYKRSHPKRFGIF